MIRHVNYFRLESSHYFESTVTNVISQLKNMPVLETFHLIGVKLKLMNLEILHSDLGPIKYLDLDELNLGSCEMPQNVTPATLITKLLYSIEDVADLYTHIQFYKYIHKKCPSVSRPERYDLELRAQNEDYVKEVYTNGVIPLYQDIGSQIDIYCFNTYCNDLDAFRKFDEYSFKLKDIQIRDQAKYIEHLHLKNMVPVPLIELKRMEALHTLEINFGHRRFRDQYQHKKTIKFSEFIGACPATLFKLVIDGVSFTFSDSPLSPTFIYCLELVYIDLTRDLAKIIETNFPKLSTLTLTGVLKSNLEISLPDHNLERVIISARYTNGPRQGFLIRTTNGDKLQYYAQRETPDGTESRNYQAIPVTKEEFDAPLVLDFTCASVKDLVLAFH